MSIQERDIMSIQERDIEQPTPAMIAAGVDATYECDFVYDPREEIVRYIYVAMLEAKLEERRAVL